MTRLSGSSQGHAGLIAIRLMADAPNPTQPFPPRSQTTPPLVPRCVADWPIPPRNQWGNS